MRTAGSPLLWWLLAASPWREGTAPLPTPGVLARRADALQRGPSVSDARGGARQGGGWRGSRSPAFPTLSLPEDTQHGSAIHQEESEAHEL